MASQSDHFVEDGYERARQAAQPQIEEEVAREYAERLAAAGLFKRLVLRHEMRREVERRLDHIAPPWGLYSTSRESCSGFTGTA